MLTDVEEETYLRTTLFLVTQCVIPIKRVCAWDLMILIKRDVYPSLDYNRLSGLCIL